MTKIHSKEVILDTDRVNQVSSREAITPNTDPAADIHGLAEDSKQMQSMNEILVQDDEIKPEAEDL